MEVDRLDHRTPNQLRPLTCSRNVLIRAHGSARWSQGDTIVLAAVYGPKAGTRKNENPEKASIEVIWKQKTGQMGKEEKECEMILRRTIQSICLLTVNPNTTTSVILQKIEIPAEASGKAFQSAHLVDFNKLPVFDDYPEDEESEEMITDKVCHINLKVVNDDGAILPCAINAATVALVDAGIPLKHLAVAISCGLEESGSVFLDPTKLEEQTMQAFAYLVFPNSVNSILSEASAQEEGEKMEHGLITAVTHGVMPVDSYLQCIERGRSASAKMSDFLRRNLQPQNTPAGLES